MFSASKSGHQWAGSAITLKPDFKIDDLQALAVFAAVVSHGSLSAAAHRLGMSPSAVSQRLRALEAAHGVTLIHRSTRRLVLTELGARVHAQCMAMVASAGAARDQLQRARDRLEGELRLSAPVGFARHVAPALAPLLAAHPALRLRMLVDDRLIDLADAGIDLALRAGHALPDSTWVARRLCAFEWVLCAAPAYLACATPPQTPDDLATHQWLAHEQGAGGLPLALLAAGGARASVRVMPRVVSNNLLTVAQMCSAGLGLAALSRPEVEDELRSGRLLAVLPGWRLEPIPVWAVTPQRARPAKVRQALEALGTALRALPGAEE